MFRVLGGLGLREAVELMEGRLGGRVAGGFQAFGGRSGGGISPPLEEYPSRPVGRFDSPLR